MNLLPKHLASDTDGMQTYDWLVNHAYDEDVPALEIAELLRTNDKTGQFLASSARYLHSIDAERFHDAIGSLVEGAIEKDREHRYIGSLLEALWGADYREKADELALADDNFRRIYKRIFPKPTI